MSDFSYVYRAEGRKIGDRDTIIATHALSLGATMVTANIGEFSRIPGLNIENWGAGRGQDVITEFRGRKAVRKLPRRSSRPAGLHHSFGKGAFLGRRRANRRQ